MPASPIPGSDELGVFIAFEGGDGAGKTTQIEQLREWVLTQDREVVVTREPGGTPLGQQIRALVLHGDHVAPRAEALLFAADRAHHVATLVRPALQRGAVVLQDRYMDSSIAYQGAGRDLDPQEVQRLSLWGTEELRPHLTVMLDVTPETGRERRGEVHDRLERETDDFHERVRQHFLALAAAEAHRYLVVDAALPLSEIAEIVRDRVDEALGRGRQ
ncbi:dTMP kinase [Luteipulveratus mongoliensis]|uniref:Thymidylate kinase n=1 Tax=Luteipulveratus mongoliensis TaxID=571913 RepID=A0A0K1JN17_9MICO|nr:dTMP kinase [Luteipulveratus mongoliensis]AKU18109.1 thymidylate kinase [Luteipulveratus mongoliensis]